MGDKAPDILRNTILDPEGSTEVQRYRGTEVQRVTLSGSEFSVCSRIGLDKIFCIPELIKKALCKTIQAGSEALARGRKSHNRGESHNCDNNLLFLYESWV